MVCPFCGVETDVAHESQQGCIDALRSEIVRVRDILQNVRSLEVSGAPELPDEEASSSADGSHEPSF